MTTRAIETRQRESTDWATTAREWMDTIRSFSTPERVLFIATLAFAALGAASAYEFLGPARGGPQVRGVYLVGVLGAVGIEAVYIGAAGFAAPRRSLRILAALLMFIGAAASAYFGAMVALRHELPQMFASPIVWPTRDEWLIFGLPALVEGIVPALLALLLSVLLHTSATGRVADAQSTAEKVRQRREMKPYACPFCDYSNDSPGKLWGHYGRCGSAMADARSDDDKKALVRLAVGEGQKRLIEG